jgi:hypothetical protein
MYYCKLVDKYWIGAIVSKIVIVANAVEYKTNLTFCNAESLPMIQVDQLFPASNSLLLLR